MNVKNILNGAALLLGMAGIFFKTQWWTGANVLILLGFGCLLISVLSFTARANAEVGTSEALNYVMVATLAVGILAVVFKFLHWPGSAVLVMASNGLLLLLTLLLITLKKTVFSHHFVTVLAVFFSLVIALFSTSFVRRSPPVPEPVAMEVPQPDLDLELE